LDISGVGTLKYLNEDLLNEFRGMEESLILEEYPPDEIQNINTQSLSK
jgi:hypothetical protein